LYRQAAFSSVTQCKPFLQWKFSEAEQKPLAKENFMVHYHVAAGSHTSGRSNEITKRRDALLKMMD
jgi:hypothetical protein